MNTTQIWNSFKNELLGFIKSRINDKELANDILQDVFIKIHLNVSKIKEDTKIESWVYQITRNAIIDYYRKKKIKTTDNFIITELPQEIGETPKDFTKCLTSFVSHLSESDEDILSKTAFEGVPQKEYALENQLTYSAKKSKVQRARQKLNKLFVACCTVETDVYGNIISEKEDCNC